MAIYEYSLEKDTLIIRTGHGQFKYKIENAELLNMADKIASEVISELQRIDHGKRSIRDDLSDYAKLMLATLNICEKHITLKNKYEQLNQTVKSMKQVLSNLDPANDPVAAKRPEQSSKTKYTPVQPGTKPDPSKVVQDRPSETSTNKTNHQPKTYISGQSAHPATTYTKTDIAPATVSTAPAIKPDKTATTTSPIDPRPAKTSVSPAPSEAIEKKNVSSAEQTADTGPSLSKERQSSLGKDNSREPFPSINPSAYHQAGAVAKRTLQSTADALPTHLAPDVPLPPSPTAPPEKQQKADQPAHAGGVTQRLASSDGEMTSVSNDATSTQAVQDSTVPEMPVQLEKDEKEEKIVPSRQEKNSVLAASHDKSDSIAKQWPRKPYRHTPSSHQSSLPSSLPGQAVSPPPANNSAHQGVSHPSLSQGSKAPEERNNAKSISSPVVKKYSVTAATGSITNDSQVKKEVSAEKIAETSLPLPDSAGRDPVLSTEKTALTEKPITPEPDKKDSLTKQPLLASLAEEEPVSTPTVVPSASFSSAEDDSEETNEGTPAPPSSYIINTPDQTNNQPLPAETPFSDAGEYVLPQLSFLKNTSSESEIDRKRIRSDAELLEKKLGYFGIKGEVMGISPGPVITTYEYKPDPGIKISKIVNLADDLALALSAYSIRIVAPIPGKDVMGIEIPNIKKSLVPFIDIVTSEAFTQCPSKVPICLGKDIIGNPVVVELESMPHLLIAGATGTGKSVGLNAMITSILYKASPDEVKFLMIDPKRIELSFYNDIPHLLTPVITDMNKANIALQWMVREMDRRYNLLAHFQVRNIEQFNQKLVTSSSPQYDEDGERLEPLPFIVVIIDELADLMMTASRDIEFSLTRLAQMARAAGIHLILATQRPSVDVLTGIIKANFPTRISFQVSSKTDSRTIIDSNGAETLLGNGDMLFVPPGTARLTRVHGTYLSEDELSDITSFIKQQRKPEYIFDVITEQEPDESDSSSTMDDEYDEKYNEALEVVLTTRQASISSIQRALRVGYNRAARIVDLMEKKGVVGPSDGVRPRKVLTNNVNMM
ncbi:DNA translocase FtsK [Desulfogranum marinum]|uniref:DNA translocase FtsK n=1 Tax=Desulfogranum marinum TaxID=453220 RepID=UPI0029C5FCBF|nr:DNA translocase FtsK [Desulfogranum marinum]